MGEILRNDPGLNRREIRICSAGTGAKDGREAHPNTSETMKEWGLALDNHRATLLTGDIVDEADLIVAMDSYVEEDIVVAYPVSITKICLLNIMDPWAIPWKHTCSVLRISKKTVCRRCCHW